MEHAESRTWPLAVTSAMFPPVHSACWKAGAVATNAASAMALPTFDTEARARKCCTAQGGLGMQASMARQT
eukprot:1147907-Pelagomonas_calceolata.AAC.4